MLKNYFKIAWRNVIKNKVSSFINIVGLATGMAVALLIVLWIWDEMSFNHYHKHHKRLAYVMSTQTFNGVTGTYPNIVTPLEKELRTKYAGDFTGLSLTWNSTNILSVGDKKISGSGKWAQPDLPGMLTLTMQEGGRESFKDPSTLLISKSLAKALFGDTDPLNKTIKVDNKIEMKVGGVYEDLPHNTTFNETKYLLPWDNKENRWNTQSGNWRNHGCALVVQLSDNADFDKTSDKIRDVINPNIKGFKEYTSLQPMDQWRLYSEFKNGKVAGGRIQFVWLFGIIGIFVLTLASINFMNLSTTRSEKRAKEVGIRKTVGSRRWQLTTQFLAEALLVSFVSFVLAIFLVQLSLPFFNSLSDKQMTIPWGNLLFWLLTIMFVFLTGLASGSYPAFYLSGFNPVKVLKGTFETGRFTSLPRKASVVVQFTVSITLIIGTIIVYKQVQFAKDRPVGYSREGLITIVMNTPELYQHYNTMRNELIEDGGAADMAESNSSTTEVWSNNNGVEWPGKDPNVDPLFGTIAVTHDFGKTVGWEIIDGRDFSREFPADSGAFILNESAVRLAGIKDPVGKVLKWLGKDHVVVGVVKDMVMESPYKPSVPTIFHMEYGWVRLITVRLKPTIPIREALVKMESVFKKYNPGAPFEYQFADENYAKKFFDEERIGNLATLFAVLAIFISCLGLFGLASFVAERRTKEIGIRKVLGASVVNLWGMLSKEFVGLVILSSIIAIPIAYYFLHSWLQSYEYRTGISSWVFAVAISGALVITLLTVSFQAIKAAIANPVKSLRTE